MAKRGGSARDRIRAYLEAHVGEVVTTHELSIASNIKEHARRIRELRDEEGMQIASHNDRHDLKPGEYMLVSLERLPVNTRKISAKLRAEVLDFYGSTCWLCGAGAGDPDPTNPARKVKMVIDHIIPISQGGTNEMSNLRLLCTACNHGKSNIQPPSETARNVLARIRKLSRDEKREIYEFLKRSLGE